MQKRNKEGEFATTINRKGGRKVEGGASSLPTPSSNEARERKEQRLQKNKKVHDVKERRVH